VTTDSGGGHAVLGYAGMYIDNWSRKYVTRQYMDDAYGHKFHMWRFPFWVTAIKMVMDKLFKGEKQ
jgi:hypothetical protein